MDQSEYTPQLLYPLDADDKQRISQLRRDQKLLIVDTFTEQLQELYSVRNPKYKQDQKRINKFIHSYLNGIAVHEAGAWVYYPWRKSLVHILEEDMFFELRTARNNTLIHPEEQRKLYKITVGIVGLSVGNSVALSLAYSGACQTMKLADPDTLALSNLNRIRATISDLGLNKTFLAARQIYEINPYAKLILYPQGITSETLGPFLTDEPHTDVLIDEADDLTTKFYLRLAARSKKIPLLMATDNGYSVDVTTIRFDRYSEANSKRGIPFLPLSEVIEGYKLTETVKLTDEEKLLLVVQLLGEHDIRPEMKHAAMQQIRKRISSWPQLGITASAAGSLATYVLKEFANHHTLRKQVGFSLQSNTSQKKKKQLELEKQFHSFMSTLRKKRGKQQL